MTEKLLFIGLLIVTCVMSAVSQVMLKKAAQKEYKSFIAQYLNFWVIISYMIFFIVVIGNIYVLKKLPMTVLGPIAETLPFILSIFFGRIFFHEKITTRKIVGSLLIIAGIITIVLVQ